MQNIKIFERSRIFTQIPEKYLIFFFTKPFKKHWICTLNIRKIFDCGQRVFDFYATHSKSFVFAYKIFVEYLFWTPNIWKVSHFGSKQSKIIEILIKTFAKYLIPAQKIWKILIFNAKHSICIVFVDKTFKKYLIFAQNIRKIVIPTQNM